MANPYNIPTRAALDYFPSVRGAVENWAPDVAGLAGDIPDAAYWLAQKLRSPATPESLGWGPAVRRGVRRGLGIQPEAPTEPQLSATDTSLAGPLTALLNPFTAVAAPAKVLKGLPLLAGVVKSKGGNWLTGSVEDALRGLRQSAISPEAEARIYPNGGAGTEIPRAINAWVEGPLTKYVKTRMATPEDEVRKLAEQEVLHIAPDMLTRLQRGSPLEDITRQARQGVGFPENGVAQNQWAKAWEGTSDAAVGAYTPEQLGDMTIAENPWLSKIPQDTRVHNINTGFTGREMESLGFDHLIDEIRNALNPASGLPRHLQLTPAAVQSMSMEKAVRRVADINAWRAAQKAEANGALARGPGQALVREYPHTDAAPNPKGLRWVELKAGETPPEGYEVKPYEGVYSAWRDGEQVQNPRGGFTGGPLRGKDEADVVQQLNRQSLADQLKYEGDTMQHCGGGYTDKVLSGESRIFSLRDAKGEPHVTVEVAQPSVYPLSGDRLLTEFGDEGKAAWEGYSKQLKENYGESLASYIERSYPALYAEMVSGTPRIAQIKGKQNRAPNEEYLPFVQDFVRNPPHGHPWGDVGDLQNTGLKDVHSMDLGGKSVPEQRFMTPAELRDYMAGGQEGALGAKEYAEGGPVSDADRVKDLLAQLQARGEIYYPKPNEPTPTIGTRG